MMGMPISMMWPMLQENLKKMLADISLHGLALTVEPEGLRISHPGGASYVITPESEHDEVMRIIGEILKPEGASNG